MSGDLFLPTGNSQISLPLVRERDGALLSLSFLHMGFRGLVEIKGNDETPFMTPYLIVDGKEYPLTNLKWKRVAHWIPTFECRAGNIELKGIILTPIGERGFVYHLAAKNLGNEPHTVKVGIRGHWQTTLHTINVAKEIQGETRAYSGKWYKNPVFDMVGTVNLFAFSTMNEVKEEVLHTYEKNAQSGAISFSSEKALNLAPGQEGTFSSYWGAAFEEIGAMTSAQEMTRKGFAKILEETTSWLLKRVHKLDDEDLTAKMNLNRFFNFFFATGMTLDTEEFVLVTSRSPRYYVSAAYWDRDSLLWSFPSILLTDQDYAREMLDYVYKKQIRNVGIHSRSIDGTVLEPGFELDELCAPIIALYYYVQKTGDREYLSESHVSKGVDHILKILATKKHSEIHLYESFLQPSDDVCKDPYLTYDNVLVWRLFKNLAELYKGIWDSKYLALLEESAAKTHKAIFENCVVAHNGRKLFAWSVDLKGGHHVYDEPPGSLQLLPYYGFCDSENEIYKNTAAEIRRPDCRFSFAGSPINEIGCEHAPHPWILAVANSLLCGRKEHAKEILKKTPLDNGIACESVHEKTGACTSGEAFATCAGFLSFALYHAFYSK